MRRGSDSIGLLVASRLLVLAILLVAGPALAGDVERVAILYETSGTCPSEPDFLSMVRKYTARWELVPEGSAAARTIRVRVVGDAAGATGSLAVERAGGAISEREIAGPHCATVTEALAVMVAVAIDPLAGAPVQGDQRAPDEGGPVHPQAPERLRQSEPPKDTPPESPWRPRIALDVRGEATSAVVRGPLFALAISMKLELPEEAGPTWLRTLQPSIGLGVRQSLPKEHALRGGSVSFLWSTGHLRLCPFRMALGRVAEVSPCLEGNIGRLGAAARGYAGVRTVSSLWVDLGGSVSAVVNLSPRFFLSSSVLVTAPLMRQEFVLASGASVSGAPSVGILGGLGAGVRL